MHLLRAEACDRCGMVRELHGFDLRLTPHGIVVPTEVGGVPAEAERLLECFAENDASGMMCLASGGLLMGAGPSVRFWHEFAAEFLRALCHVPEGGLLEEIAGPDSARLAEWVLNAPPMSGGEYLGPEVLKGVWQRLTTWTATEVAAAGGLAAFLEARASRWVRVGRVTLHLAENKTDVEFPFAFMATYAAGLSAAGKIRRLPLGNALKEYADRLQKPELIKLLTPLNQAAKRSGLIRDLVDSGDIFHPLVWTPREAYTFLSEIPLYEESGLLAQLPNWWKRRARPKVSVKLDSRKGGEVGKDSLLQFDISVVLGEEQLSKEEIERLLHSGDNLVQLRGEWVEVDSERLQQALAHWEQVERRAGRDGVSFIEGMRLLAGASSDSRPANEDDGVDESRAWHRVEATGALREKLAALRAPGGIHGDVPRSLRATLRGYQLAGLNWLWLCSQLGVGACLADDMGLGKTIQVLATLLRHREAEPHAAPALLVVPASLIGNWKAEAARFAPSLRLAIAHPSETPRADLDALSNSPEKFLQGVDLVVTTYSMATRLEWLAESRWSWVVLDEAQAIKSPGAGQTKAVKKLNGSMRVALTGTPVENRLGDLWSIFDFINAGLLGSAAKFKEFAKDLEKRGHAQYAPLRRLVAPYILRRMKTDPGIAPDLPEKTEMQVFCGLSKPQAVLYQRAVTALARALDDAEGSGIERRGLVLAALTRFKQICNHPSLFTGDGGYLPEASAKFMRLASLCEEIASRGEKVLVFTQFREITDPLATHLASIFGRDGLILHGGTAVKSRKELVAEFQREEGPPFFILSLKAGGTGLNLTAASHVIHFDRWWNPAVESQATDRAFRIGQRRNVLVHKFVTRGTIEEKIDTIIARKQQMSAEILEGDAGIALTEMSDEQILEMVTLDLERATA
jgi:superfamily II DNA or RNA helicase